jgi:hypothetical protein
LLSAPADRPLSLARCRLAIDQRLSPGSTTCWVVARVSGSDRPDWRSEPAPPPDWLLPPPPPPDRRWSPPPEPELSDGAVVVVVVVVVVAARNR